jgi:hypothetical protein
MYHGTSETLGTTGTLVPVKTPFLHAKRAFLSAFYLIFRAKNRVFNPKND